MDIIRMCAFLIVLFWLIGWLCDSTLIKNIGILISIVMVIFSLLDKLSRGMGGFVFFVFAVCGCIYVIYLLVTGQRGVSNLEDILKFLPWKFR